MLNNKFLQILCVVLVSWSMLGGLLLPLSSNIESITYTQLDSTIEFVIEIPNLKEVVEEFYLENPNLRLKSIKSNKMAKNYIISFDHPKFYQAVDKGASFDLLCRTKSVGDLRSFNAFYLDTALKIKSSDLLVLPDNAAPFKFSFPNRMILKQSIRNLFFHVPMWFTMITLLFYSLIQSILFLSKGDLKYDLKAKVAAQIALYFGILGILTGMVWAKYTWGAFWTNDPKLNGAAIGMLAYFAYFILRSSVEDHIKRGKLSAVYNIFSFTIYMVFIMILPRINDSLHPGNGGNPGFNVYEQDNVMRLFFYPAVIGWIMLSFWIKDLYENYELRNIQMNKSI